MSKTLSEIEAEYNELVIKCRADLKQIKELVGKIKALNTEVKIQSKEAHKAYNCIHPIYSTSDL